MVQPCRADTSTQLLTRGPWMRLEVTDRSIDHTRSRPSARPILTLMIIMMRMIMMMRMKKKRTLNRRVLLLISSAMWQMHLNMC